MKNSEFSREVIKVIDARIDQCGFEPKDQALKNVLLENCLEVLRSKLDENSVFAAKKRLLKQAQVDLDCQQKKVRDQNKNAGSTKLLS